MLVSKRLVPWKIKCVADQKPSHLKGYINQNEMLSNSPCIHLLLLQMIHCKCFKSMWLVLESFVSNPMVQLETLLEVQKIVDHLKRWVFPVLSVLPFSLVRGKGGEGSMRWSTKNLLAQVSESVSMDANQYFSLPYFMLTWCLYWYVQQDTHFDEYTSKILFHLKRKTC